MGDKSPAFQFYVKDWLSDTELRMASPSTRGIWIDCLCFMWTAVEKGKLAGTVESISRLLSANREDVEAFLIEARELGFADVSEDGHGRVTVINRRLYRKQIERENARLRKQRQRESRQGHGKCHGDVRAGHEKVTANVTPKNAKNTQGVTAMSQGGVTGDVTPTSRAITHCNNAGLPGGHGEVPRGGGAGCHDDVTSYSSSPSKTSLKSTPSSPPKTPVEYPEDFERFYRAFPKKRNKPGAYRAWRKAEKDGVLPPVGALLEALEGHKQSREWTKEGGEYIPYPASWINGQRWNDELTPAGTVDGDTSFIDRAALIYKTVCEGSNGEQEGDHESVIEVDGNIPAGPEGGPGNGTNPSPRIFEGFKALPGPGRGDGGGHGD